jgi:hypothetical protein
MNLTRILAVVWIVMESLTVGHSQGLIIFNNRVSGEVDARVTFPDGTPVGAGFTAQLYGGPAGTPVDLLTPLLPTTTFRTGAAMGYIFQVEVRVPGVPRFEDATVQMRVYDGESWESSLIRGDSNIITLTTISETWPSEYLIGLRPFQVSPIPEPGTAVLFACGVAGLLAFHRLGRRSRSARPLSAGTLVPP